jgi:SAM-dependent methyltransferase
VLSGGGGIRTLVGPKWPETVFETAAFNHSATPPKGACGAVGKGIWRGRATRLPAVALHPLAATFGAVADSYERGRPDYPPAVVGALAAELGLGPGAPVLDLAAGTGKLTRALVAAGLDVIAVEPQPELRAKLEAVLPAERILDGTAEEIPLGDGSVEAVTVADGFHWFRGEEALEEIRRVLRPGGGLAVLTTIPDWSGASWADELGNLINDLRPEHPFFDGPPWSEALTAAGDWTEAREITVTAAQPSEPERIVELFRSMSWVAALPDDEREARTAQVAELVGAGTMPPELPINFILGLSAPRT